MPEIIELDEYLESLAPPVPPRRLEVLPEFKDCCLFCCDPNCHMDCVDYV